MEKTKEELWNAFMDGELSAEEARAFEGLLSAEERDRLAADAQFEEAVCSRLADATLCPKALWDSVKAKMDSDSEDNVVSFGGRRKTAGRPQWFSLVPVAAALLVAFGLFTFINNSSTQNDSALVMAATSVNQLARTSSVSDDPAEIARFLHDKGIDLILADADSIPMAKVHFSFVLIGARTEYIDGKPVQSVLFGCCEHPIKLIVAVRNSPSGQALSEATSDGTDVQSVEVVGEYVAAVVGQHPAEGLFDMFEEKI